MTEQDISAGASRMKHGSGRNIFSRTYHHLKRYRQIIAILVKYGFSDLVGQMRLDREKDIPEVALGPEDESIENLDRAERIRLALEELGPTFIKLGQVLSTRADILPSEIVQELVHLQDDVPPFGFDEARHIIQDELGGPLEDFFTDFEETPLAAASLAQVHKATLPDGKTVAVKVQRPGIRATIDIDLDIMLYFAGLLENHVAELEVYEPTKLVKEFARAVQVELDYTTEASHIELFAMHFNDDPTIYVPTVHKEVSRRRVIVMDFVDGIKASDAETLTEGDYNLEQVAENGFNSMLTQIFVNGFFHADPHPGNILVLPDNVLCFLDFGIMGHVDATMQDNIADLIVAVAKQDERQAVRVLLRLSESDTEIDVTQLERDISLFVRLFVNKTLEELEIGKMLYAFMDITARYRLRFGADLLLMVKALSMVEAAGRKLVPNFNFIERAEPFLTNLRKKRLSPKRLAIDAFETSLEIAKFMKEAPGDIRELINQARTGRLGIRFEHRGLESLLTTLDRISNRLAFAVVIAALVIGSALIVLSGIPPTWHEIPLLGLAGFLGAGVMGFWLLVSILRRGSM